MGQEEDAELQSHYLFQERFGAREGERQREGGGAWSGMRGGWWNPLWEELAHLLEQCRKVLDFCCRWATSYEACVSSLPSTTIRWQGRAGDTAKFWSEPILVIARHSRSYEREP